MAEDEKIRIDVYCTKCGDLINKIELFNEIPETIKNHVICRGCYDKWNKIGIQLRKERDE